MKIRAVLLLLASWLGSVLALSPQEQLAGDVGQLFGNTTSGQHTNNWAILVCASRYWFNYRHMANTLAMYRTIKRLGIPDSQIILMLADDVSCNARNSFPAQVYANKDRKLDLYGKGIEVDYRGYEVTVESFLRLLTGRQPAHTPPSKRLLTDSSSNVFIYMTGHGGNEFLKFQDNEEVSAFDIADAIEQMSEKRRYNKLLFAIDTCQANTMYTKFYSPDIIATGSSELGESSYSHHNDMDIGVAVIDAYTRYILGYLETITKTSKATLQQFFDNYNPTQILSHPGISTELSTTKPEDILVTDFFGGVANVEVTPIEAGLPGRKGEWEASSRSGRKAPGEDVPTRQAVRPFAVDSARGWTSSTETSGESAWRVILGLFSLLAIGALTIRGAMVPQQTRVKTE